MKKISFGVSEDVVPSKFCKNLNYIEGNIKYDVSKISFRTTARGCLLELPLEYGEQVFGFGLQLKGFNHKNNKLLLRANSDPSANTGDTHAPVPFFVTTKGYGIYIDTARYVEVYCGIGNNKNRNIPSDNTVITTAEALYKKTELKETTVMTVEIPVSKGVDIYIFEGDTITDITAEYNMLSGGGCRVPEWGLGVLYRPFAGSDENDIIRLAEYMRKNDIPCDILGLESGWQSNTYSCTYTWDSQRFPNYKSMIRRLKEMGFHINLWEHAFVHCSSPVYDSLKDKSGNYEVWKGIIPDFAVPEAQDIFAGHHREYLVRQGIDGFKLDECDNSDFVHDWSFPNCTRFPSGLDGELYHSLFGTLYMQTILKALGDIQTLSQVRNAGALAASYPFVLYSDLYDHKDFIRGVANSGFCRILWAPEVRHAENRNDFIRRLQTCVFSVQCVINAWYCENAPWVDWQCEEEARELLKLRHRLIPMLKAAFDKYRISGVSPVRALVMDYTNDKETYHIDDQYIFCDMIVAPITNNEKGRKVYLPQGEWVDYWTKKKTKSGWFWVETDNIPVYRYAHLKSSPGDDITAIC